MKVLLVSNYELDDQESMLRYAEWLRRSLEERGHEMEIISPAVVVGALVSIRNPLSKWLGYVDKFVLFPRRLRSKSAGFDLVHICDHSNSPYLKWASSTPRIITVHDLLAIRSALGDFPENPTRRTGRWLQQWILRGLTQARHLISVSGKTREDLEALLQSHPAITVVHHSLNWEFAPSSPAEIAQVRAACGLVPGDEYLLHVGGNQWYKNRLGVLKIALELRKHARFKRAKLILAGKPWSAEMRAFATKHSFADAIEFVCPTNEQVRALYSGALAVLFPSLQEGFGWPILEAQACDCLVVTSNRAPMTEVAGEGAILINPEDEVAAAQTIAAKFAEAEAIRQAARENLKRFSTDRAMDLYLAAYGAAIAASRSGLQRN
ncbi:MAG: glycosyltransferase family 4 protein [Silvibacterium sp.]|nr:glycosyltransferase family 4 protein [Silvibacterium sp.]MBV8436306.1 glycosyltransferase family 4 protein [Silvibacterium sp.]